MIELNKLVDIARGSNIEWKQFSKILHHPVAFYDFFTIKKRSGGFRTLVAPKPELDDIQSFILENILKFIPIHECAHGFVNEKSILTNARQHQNSDFVLSLDLENFFPSINRNRLYHVFLNLCGYKNLIARALVNLVALWDGLPQGARTSPALSNIVAFQMDRVLSKFCMANNITYTRYADDLTFSGPKDSINMKLFYKIKWYIEKQGFKINPKKTFFSSIAHGAMITGLRVYKNRIIVPRHYVKKVETELYYLEKYDVDNVKQKQHISNRNYLGHLKGKINFINYIEPKIGEVLLNRFDKIHEVNEVLNEEIGDYLRLFDLVDN